MELSSDLLTSSGVGALFMGIFLWLFKRNEKRNADEVQEIKSIAQKAQHDVVKVDGKIKDLHIHVTENFSNKIETNAAIARVHKQIEKMGDEIAKRVDTLQTNVRQDIQSLRDERKD